MILGLVRGQEAGLQAFLSSDGFSLLMRGMQSENEKLRTKSAFLLLNLLMEHPEQKGMRLNGTVLLDQYVIFQRCMTHTHTEPSDLSKMPAYSCFLLPADTVVSMGMVQQLISVLRTPHSPFHEHVLGALCW